MAVLIDTNIFLALAYPLDVNHQRARETMRDLKDVRIVPAPVLPEVFYMVRVRRNYLTAVQTLKLLRTGGFQIEPLTSADRKSVV